jgi:hypothetical protein
MERIECSEDDEDVLCQQASGSTKKSNQTNSWYRETAKFYDGQLLSTRSAKLDGNGTKSTFSMAHTSLAMEVSIHG